MIIVNPSTRQFNIPGADLVFGVTADAGSVTKEFSCPRYVGNNLDLTGCFIRMNYRNANGEIDSHLIEDVMVDGDNIVFDWELSPKVTMYKGNISFVMCATGPDTKVAWHTTLGRGQVLEGLEPEWEPIMDDTADVVAQLITMVERQTTAVEKTGADQVAVVKAAAKTAQSDAVAQIEAKGVNTLASIPDDYTAVQSAVDGVVRGKAPAVVCEAAGSAIAVNDASDMAIQGMKIFGRSTQDGTPTPEAPVEIVSVENPTITVNEQTLTIPRILPGIPVTSGGNYTDSDGQQWICDEVDLGRGVYVQRCSTVVLDGVANKLTKHSANVENFQYRIDVDNIINNAVVSQLGELLCNIYVPTTVTSADQPQYTIRYQAGGTRLYIMDNRFANADDFNSWLSQNPVVVLYRMAKTVETPLSETEIAAYRALHSNYPNTTVLNDAGAHMVVKYAADTKLYIDNKIAALVGG